MGKKHLLSPIPFICIVRQEEISLLEFQYSEGAPQVRDEACALSRKKPTKAN